VATKINMKDFERNIAKLFDEFSSVETMRKIGEYTAERIKLRTKLGKGVEKTGADPAPLKKLSEGYVKTRKRKKAELEETSPAKSNLTFTGQMLNALKLLQALPARAIVGIESSKRESSNLTNDEVAGFVSKDRPFLNLSKAELNGINAFIRKLLDAMIRKP
jgi:hypothetical protein